MCILIQEGILRSMEATRRCPCRYCEGDIFPGDLIMGDYGIRWGHIECVKIAYDQKKLIPSGINQDRMNPELKARVLPYILKNCKKAPALSDMALGIPDSACPFFKPQLIQVLTLPDELALNPKMVTELTAREHAKAKAQIWNRYIDRWLSEYKLHHTPPACPVHQWSHDQALHMRLWTDTLNEPIFGSRRALWWYCPGT